MLRCVQKQLKKSGVDLARTPLRSSRLVRTHCDIVYDEDEEFHCPRSRVEGGDVDFVEASYPHMVSDPPAGVDFAWMTLYQDGFLNQNRKSDLGTYCGIANTDRL
jgi:hypothetical protein